MSLLRAMSTKSTIYHLWLGSPNEKSWVLTFRQCRPCTSNQNFDDLVNRSPEQDGTVVCPWAIEICVCCNRVRKQYQRTEGRMIRSWRDLTSKCCDLFPLWCWNNRVPPRNEWIPFQGALLVQHYGENGECCPNWSWVSMHLVPKMGFNTYQHIFRILYLFPIMNFIWWFCPWFKLDNVFGHDWNTP